MAGEDLLIRAVLELKARSAKLQEGIDGLKKTKKSADAAATSLKKGEKAAKSFGGSLARIFGGALLVRFVGQSVVAFGEWERQLRTTAAEAERLGLDVKETQRRVEELTIAIEKQTGILRRDTIGVYNKFLGLTGDVEQATVLLRAAVGAEEAGFKDLTTAANLLGSILQGEVIEPSKSLGLAFDQAKTSAEQQADVLEQALDKFLNLSGGIDDTKGALDQLSAGWAEFKLALGEGLAETVKFVGGFSNITTVFKSLGPIAVKTFNQVVGGLRGLTLAFSTFNIRKLLTGDFEGMADDIAAAFAAGMETVKFEIEGAQDELDDLWSQSAGDRVQTEKAAQEAIGGLLSEAATRQRTAKEKADKEAADKAAEKRLEFERDMQDRLLRVQIEAAAEGSEERLALELEMLDRLHERALEEAERRNADVALVDELFREMREQATIDQEDEARDKRRDLFKERFKDAKKEATEEIKLDAKKEAAKLKIAKAAAEQKRDMAFAIANQAIALGRELFGENKLIAIAQAVINTAEGVTRALADPGGPAGIALAALVAATGAAQIATIASTDIGSRGASGAGVSFGTAAAASIPSGSREGDPSTPFQALPQQQQERQAEGALGLVVNFNGNNIIDDASLRRFARRIDRARARDQSRSLR